MLFKTLAFLTLLALCKAQKTSLFVYYESLCPDSARFINDQLYPTAKDFGKFLDIKFVPYGKSTYNTQGSDVLFQCHHGPNECFGNKVHACAIEHIQVDSFQHEHTRETLILEYVNCLMKLAQFKDAAFPGKRCAQEVGVKNWDVIEQCANSTEGSKLLQKNGDLTIALQNSALTNVPTIAFKQTFEADVQRDGINDLRKQLCKKLSPSPDLCRNQPGNGAQSLSAITLFTLVSVIIAKLF
uniref:Putative gamma-interferon inducible lysosomal thiol reductase-like protein n=1 Tax=Corethrella appendiculata TaxID=1370023 RepID=U5ENG0_9DIPT